MGKCVLSVDYSRQIAPKHTHYHDCHQLLFVTGGTADVYVNNALHKVEAGNLVIFSRLEHHAVTAQSPDYTRYTLDLAPDISTLSRDGYRIYSVLFNRPVGFSNILDVGKMQEELCRLFEMIQRELQRKAPMHEDMLELLVQQLLIFIYRQTQGAFSAVEEDCFEIVHEIQNRFHREFQKQVSLTELAQSHNISVSYLSHLFKATTGSSVMAYLQSCRIAEAKKCLAQTNMRMSEIVERCGFSDSSNFSRIFRNATGLSPTDFRERFRRIENR